MSTSKPRVLIRAEWLLALAMTAAVIAAHVCFYNHAGGLWRDEANTVNIATSSTWSTIFASLEFDSYPPLWHFCVRLWSKSGFGQSDAALRILGLIIGLSLLAAIWLQRRSFAEGPPLFALAAVAMQPMVVRYGDSMRAYGLGMLTMIAMYVAIWRATERCTIQRWGVAVLAAISAVYTLYHNCAILLALCAAGVAVSLSRRDWKACVMLPAIGLIAAVVLLLGNGNLILHGPDWLGLVVSGKVDAPWLVEKFIGTLRAGDSLLPVFWGVAAISAIAAVVVHKRLPTGNDPAHERAKLIFLASGAVLAPLCYLAFLLKVGFTTQAWYYLVLIAFLGITLDQLSDTGIRSKPGSRWLRLLFIGVMFCIGWPALWNQANLQMTTIDVMAEKLNQLAQPGDVIVVNPWWVGIPFGRYYHGQAEWTTVPDIEDHSCHRYDLIKKRMAEKRPLASVFEKIDRALQSGHQVYLGITEDIRWDPSQEIAQLPPAPHGPMGWYEPPYEGVWSQQVFAYLSKHATEAIPIPEEEIQQVQHHERMEVVAFRGWVE